MMLLKQRTPDGIKGYEDGYRACVEQFKEYLSKYSTEEAIQRMDDLASLIAKFRQDILNDCAWR